jgi:putative methionine-R-sulfoxide reductase with GAF domain
MAEDLQLPQGSRTEKYQALFPQIQGLLHGENDLTANLANIAAAIKEVFGFFWVGFWVCINKKAPKRRIFTTSLAETEGFFVTTQKVLFQS